MILGGISLLVFVICQIADSVSPFMRTNTAGAQLILFLSFIVNQPHYSATYYRVYRGWDEVKRYSIVSIWLPLVLLILAAGCFAAPQAMAPWFCKAYFLSVSYHYAGQTYGIALIFLRKIGISITRFIKISVGLPVYSSALLWLIGDEVISRRRYYSGVELALVGFPSWTYLFAMFILVFGIMLYIAMTITLASRGQKVPLIVHIVVVAQLTWFTMAPRLEFFGLLVPFFHCLQYLLITTYFYLQEISKRNPIKAQDFFASKYFIKYYALLFLLGVILFHGVPNLLAYAGIASILLSTAIVHSFINLHHFLIDGEIWKLRKPEVAELLVTSKD